MTALTAGLRSVT